MVSIYVFMSHLSIYVRFIASSFICVLMYLVIYLFTIYMYLFMCVVVCMHGLPCFSLSTYSCIYLTAGLWAVLDGGCHPHAHGPRDTDGGHPSWLHAKWRTDECMYWYIYLFKYLFIFQKIQDDRGGYVFIYLFIYLLLLLKLCIYLFN